MERHLVATKPDELISNLPHILKHGIPEAEILQSDLRNEPLPYEDNSFDYVFSKSVLEHFYYPEELVQEIFRILKPGGLVITMVPDWVSVYKTFYDDYTHHTQNNHSQNYATTIRYHKINTATGLKSSSQNLIKLLTLQENQEENNVLLMKIESSNEL